MSEIKQDKELAKSLKQEFEYYYSECLHTVIARANITNNRVYKNRKLSLAITKLEEADLWIRSLLEDLN